jgi:hypothetical protein
MKYDQAVTSFCVPILRLLANCSWTTSMVVVDGFAMGIKRMLVSAKVPWHRRGVGDM